MTASRTEMLVRGLMRTLEAVLADADAQEMVRRVEPIPLGSWCHQKDVRKAFGISPATVRRWAILGKVAARRIGDERGRGTIIYRTADIDKVLAEMPQWDCKPQPQPDNLTPKKDADDD